MTWWHLVGRDDGGRRRKKVKLASPLRSTRVDLHLDSSFAPQLCVRSTNFLISRCREHPSPHHLVETGATTRTEAAPHAIDPAAVTTTETTGTTGRPGGQDATMTMTIDMLAARGGIIETTTSVGRGNEMERSLRAIETRTGHHAETGTGTTSAAAAIDTIARGATILRTRRRGVEGERTRGKPRSSHIHLNRAC